MASWPDTLPDAFLKAGFNESPPDLLLRSEMDQGPDKVRRKGTAGVRPISGNISMTEAQVDILDIFYTDTLMHGAARFSWKHQRTQAPCEFRFVEPPIYELVDGDLWQVAVKLEIMP